MYTKPQVVNVVAGGLIILMQMVLREQRTTPDNLSTVKQKFGIAPQYQSCHTAVSKKGYIFEGHISADVMQRFMLEKPAGALELAVPRMPIGSPGMEMGDRFDNHDVLLLNKEGSSQVYARIRP